MSKPLVSVTIEGREISLFPAMCIATLVLAALKVTVVEIGWLLVFAPFWLPVVVGLFVLVFNRIMHGGELIIWRHTKDDKKEIFKF